MHASEEVPFCRNINNTDITWSGDLATTEQMAASGFSSQIQGKNTFAHTNQKLASVGVFLARADLVINSQGMKDRRWKYSPWNDPSSTSRDSLNGVALSAPGRTAAPYCSASWLHMLLPCSPSTVSIVPPCPHNKHRTHTEYLSTSKELRMEAEDLTGKWIVWCLILNMRKGKRGKDGSTGPCSGREAMRAWGRGSGCASIPDFPEDNGAGRWGHEDSMVQCALNTDIWGVSMRGNSAKWTNWQKESASVGQQVCQMRCTGQTFPLCSGNFFSLQNIYNPRKLICLAGRN